MGLRFGGVKLLLVSSVLVCGWCCRGDFIGGNRGCSCYDSYCGGVGGGWW